MWRLRLRALLLVGVVLSSSACIPYDNDSGGSDTSLAVINHTDQVVVWIRGIAGSELPAVLARGLPLVPILPGESLSRGVGGASQSDQYCSVGDQWILSPRSPDFVEQPSMNFSAQDFEVVEVVSSGHCWGSSPPMWSGTSENDSELPRVRRGSHRCFHQTTWDAYEPILREYA